MNKRVSTCLMLGTLAILIGVKLQAQSVYSNAVAALNPVGYWPLDETTPPPPLNLVETNLGSLGAAGNGFYGAWYQPSGTSFFITNNISQTNGITLDGDSALNCQYLPGQYIVLPRNANGSPVAGLTIAPPFSIEAWVKPQTTVARSGRIVCEGQVNVNTAGPDPSNPFNGGLGSGWAGFVLGQYQNYFAFVTFCTNAQSKVNELDSPKTIVVGQWVHLVVTCDGTRQTMYENGVQVAQKTMASNSAGITYVPDPTSPLMIGSGNDVSASTAGAYTGPIDEVAIYTNILSAGSILAHYQTAYGTNATFAANYSNAVLADSPTIYFRMDSAQSITNAGYNSASFPVANNYGSAGTAANGVYQPGTTPGVAGPNYAGFGGNSRSVAINGWFGAVDVGGGSLPAALNPTGTAALTVVSWFKTAPADAPGRFQEILGHSDSSYRLALGQVAGENHFNPGPGPELQFTTAADLVTNGFAFNDGHWHMVAGVSDGTNEFLYLDGALAKHSNNAAGINIVGSPLDLLLGGDPQYTVANVSAANTIRNFDGQIAQVAIWTNALTQNDIQSLFTAADVPPYIYQQPLSATNNAGANVVIAAGIRGSSVSYQWYKNGSPVSGQTNENLILSPAGAGDGGSYYVVAGSAYGSVTSSPVNLMIYGPPVVQQQTPADLQIFNGASPTLRVTAQGAQPIYYQWTLNGSAISGATNASYTVANVQTFGTYGCSLSNFVGMGSITPIALTPNADPTTPYPVAVIGDSPIAYFRLDESSGTNAYDYLGGNNGIYTNVSLGNPGYNSLAQVKSDPGETAAEFGDYPPNNNYAGNVPAYLNFGTANGSNAQFSVEAWFTEYLFLNGGNGIVSLGYGNGGEQFVLDTGNGTSGTLRFLVRNAVGTASSANSTYVPANDGLWHHAVGVCDEAGGHLYIYLDGALAGTATIAPGSGLLASTRPLTIGARPSSNSNPVNYDFQFLGEIDDVSLFNYSLTAAQVANHYYASGVAPQITQLQPGNSIASDEGQSITVTATLRGTAPFVYSWYDNNGSLITGATNATLALNNLQTSQAGNYQLTVSNPYGSASTNFNLSIGSGPPVIAVDLGPLNAEAYEGTADSFSVTVSGSSPFGYQWYQDGEAVAGATNHTYAFTVLAGMNTYYCAVTNSASGGTPTYSSTGTVTGVAAPTLNPGDYSARLKVTFAGYNRPEILKDFPVLVRLGTNVPGFSYSQFAAPDGGDLRFTDGSGTREIPYEINQWNPAGVSTVWVQVPALAGTNDALWAYWGNPAAATAPDYTTNGSVWVPPAFESLPPYAVVYHLEQSGAPYLDSTLQYPAASTLAPAPTNGVAGQGGLFNRAAYLDAGTVSLANAFTLSAWVNVSSAVADIQCVWANGPGVSGSDEVFFFVNDYKTSDGALTLASGNGTTAGNLVAPPGSVSLDQWHLVTAAVDRANGQAQLYVDGSPVAAGAVRNDFSTNSDLQLGRDTGGTFAFLGGLDEARIRASLSSSNWVWASYMTVAQNATFENYAAVASSSVTVSLQHQGAGLVLTWSAGTLQSAPQATGPYQNVPGATSPYSTSPTANQQFYRVKVK